MERKTALITGASRGIGAATARRLARAGYAVAVNYCNNEDRALALVEELRAEGHTAMAVRADVSDPEQVQAMVDNVLDKFCQLDILVCNAGRSWVGLLGDMTAEAWRELFSVNLDGVFYCCKAVLPHMIHRKQGKIITISSMWGQVGASCEVCYSATKGAVIALTKALAKELGPSGIRVNCVAPGVIETDMLACYDDQVLEELAEETPLGRNGTPEDVARAIVQMLDAPFVTGQILGVNGGFVI